MMDKREPIPSAAWEKIKDFLGQRKTGEIILDVKNGYVLGWRITEAGRVSVPAHLTSGE